MFRHVRVNVLGLIENMSYMVVPGTSQRIDVFGEGGGKRTAEAMEIPFLGEVPLEPQVRPLASQRDRRLRRGTE